jgi:hypothetical protein
MAHSTGWYDTHAPDLVGRYEAVDPAGSVVALEASTGKLQWKGYTIVQEAKPTATNAAGVEMMGPSGAAIWSSPTFDGVTRRVYVTTGDNYSDPPTDTSDAILGAATASSSRAVPLSRCPSFQSARPRLACVAAHWSGTRSRVYSSNAARWAATASSSRVVPLSRCPSFQRARPKLVCVDAHWSGIRSRVLSSSAAR